jgi:hypothetical protein
MNYPWYLIHWMNDIVQAWADGEPNYGFQLTAGDESDLRNWRRYRTEEHTDPYPAHGRLFPWAPADTDPWTTLLGPMAVLTSLVMSDRWTGNGTAPPWPSGMASTRSSVP